MKLRALLVVCVTALVAVVAASPAAAQQQGLVNVAITDTNVQVPIGVAANVCGVAANVLATAANLGDVDCTADGVAIAQNGGGGGGQAPAQEGLINLAITNTNIQVPVSVAANICGVAVNVLARALNTGGISCTATGVTSASR